VTITCGFTSAMTPRRAASTSTMEIGPASVHARVGEREELAVDIEQGDLLALDVDQSRLTGLDFVCLRYLHKVSQGSFLRLRGYREPLSTSSRGRLHVEKLPLTSPPVPASAEITARPTRQSGEGFRPTRSSPAGRGHHGGVHARRRALPPKWRTAPTSTTNRSYLAA
jgi:hypothetical protein